MGRLQSLSRGTFTHLGITHAKSSQSCSLLALPGARHGWKHQISTAPSGRTFPPWRDPSSPSATVTLSLEDPSGVPKHHTHTFSFTAASLTSVFALAVQRLLLVLRELCQPPTTPGVNIHFPPFRELLVHPAPSPPSETLLPMSCNSTSNALGNRRSLIQNLMKLKGKKNQFQ